MALVKGKFVDKDQLIQANSDPVDAKDLTRKSYVDQKAADAAAAKIEDAIVDGVTGKAPSQNAVYDALALKSNVGHTHVASDITDFTSAAKTAAVSDSITDGITDKAPSQNAVFDALALKQNSLGTGTTAQYLRGDLTWQSIPKAAKTYTVGVDASTIAGCIALCASPTMTNNYVIEIPPGSYTEDLTIPGNVHLKGMANPNDSLSVKITGQHTIAGASANALNNRVCIANILFVSSHATTPMFAIYGNLAETEVQMTGCFLQNVNTATTAKLFNLSLYGKLYINNSRTRMAASTQGGTHFAMAAGSSLYTQYGLDTDGGTCVIDMTGQGYAQIQYGQLGCSGTSAIKISANGMVILSQSSLTNGASIGSGVNMVGAGASFFASHTVFNILDNAASYVVTGVAGTAYGMYANNYSHLPGIATRNTKIGASVAQVRYTGSLTSADVNDFAAAAKAAAVQDAIVDGVTSVAPSQNAVFDALALKLNATLKGAVNGLAELDGSGKVPLSQIPASVGAVQSVNSKTGSVVLVTDDIAESGTPTNKWFTDARAKAATLSDAIVDGVTDKAPSQNAVYDALALKLDQASKGAAGGVAELDGSGKVPSTQLPSYVDDVVEAANLASLPGTGETGKIYVTLDTNKCYRWSGSTYIEISASPGSTDAVAEGTTNLYFTAARAKSAAVVNSTSGSETDQAASVSAMKTYVGSQISAIPAPQQPTGKKERFVLTSGDIANGYVDCAFEAMADTMILMTGGVVHNEGSGDDYVLSVVGGKTRISFEPDLQAILAAGDDIYVQYLRLV